MRLNRRQKTQIQSYFEDKPEVKVVYLYGSQTRGKASNLSDVDLGVLLDNRIEKTKAFDLQLEYIGEAESILGKELAADVKILDMNKPLEYLQGVISEGEALVVNDKSEKVSFESNVQQRYLDFYPVLERYYDKMSQRIAKGRYAS